METDRDVVEIDGTSSNDVVNRNKGVGKDDTVLDVSRADIDASNVIDLFEGDDLVNAGDGDDVVFGGPGDDSLKGSLGRDELFGGSGNDFLDGEVGDGDRLTGGEGDDIFSFGTREASSEVDVITDFEEGDQVDVWLGTFNKNRTVQIEQTADGAVIRLNGGEDIALIEGVDADDLSTSKHNKYNLVRIGLDESDAEPTPEEPAPDPAPEPTPEPAPEPVSEATIALEAPSDTLEIEFASIDDASGDTARLDVEFTLGSEVVETAQARVEDGTDRTLALSSSTDFDGVRLIDAEGDVTFTLAASDPLGMG